MERIGESRGENWIGGDTEIKTTQLDRTIHNWTGLRLEQSEREKSESERYSQSLPQHCGSGAPLGNGGTMAGPNAAVESV